MSLETILLHIKNDELEQALYKTKEYFKDKINEESTAADHILRSLNQLLYEFTNKNRKSRSNGGIVFNIANICCKNITCHWKCKEHIFMQCVYHVKRYLINQGHVREAKSLCNYYFILKKKKKKVSWNSKENIVIRNTILNFLNVLYEKDINLYSNLNGPDDESVISWLHFIWELIELSNFERLYPHFGLTSNLLIKMNEIDSVHKKEFISLCIFKYSEWFEELRLSNTKIISNEKEINVLISFFDSVIYCLKDDDLTNMFLKSLLTLVEKVDSVIKLPCLKNRMYLISRSIMLCEKEFDQRTEVLCVEINSILKKNMTLEAQINSCTVCFVTHLFFKLRFKMSDKLNGKGLLVEVSKMLLNLFSIVKLENAKENKKIIEQVNLLYLATSLIPSSPNSKENLLEVYQNILKVFKAFVSIEGLALKSGLLNFAVSGCVNAIIYYKRAELYAETASLSKVLLKYFIKLDRNVLIELKGKVNYTINAFAQSHGKNNKGTQALAGLIAVAGIHKEFAETAFKGWADIKNYHRNSSLTLDTTVKDVISDYSGALNLDWGISDTNSLNVDQLLLYEVQAYSKHRDLQKEPVLAVYRTAASACTNQMLLAQILISAVDAITSQEEVAMKINNFELSIANIIQNLMRRCNEAKQLSEKTFILWLLGNLHYQQLRCGLVQLRKKAEAEVRQLDIQPKNEIPILQANEADALNECSVSLAFTYLKLDTQGPILDSMAKTLSFWKQAVEILTPDIANSNFTHSLKFVKGLGYLYRLYNFKVKEIETWEMLYKLGEILCSPKYTVLAVAELLTLKLNVDEKWVENAKKSLDDEDLNENSYVYQLFHLGLAKNSNNNKKIEECLKLLNSMDVEVLKRNYLIYVQHQMLLSQISTMKVELSSQIPNLFIGVKVFENVLYMIINGKWDTFSHLCVLQCILLDLSVFLGKMYADMEWVRHARCYTQKQLTVAQRLAIPIRVSEFLYLLGNVDIRCVKTDDCDIKLRGIEAILELEDLPVDYFVDNDCNNGASPNLREKLRAKPISLCHPDSCTCYHCSNIDYQIQSLQAITLRASYFAAQNQKSQALQVFKVGKELLQNIKKRHSHTNFQIATSLLEGEVRFYAGMINALEQWEMVNKALKYCERAITCVDLPFEFSLLKNVLCYEKIALKWTEDIREIKIEKEQGLTPLMKKMTLTACVTPENLESNIQHIAPNEIPKLPVSPLITSFRRKLVLDFENEENTPIKEKVCEIVEKKCPIPRLFLDEEITKDMTTRKKKPQKGNLSKSIKENIMEKQTSKTERKSRKKIDGNCFISTTPLMNLKKPARSAIKIYCDVFDEEDTTGIKQKGVTRKETHKKKTENEFKGGTSSFLISRKLKFEEESSPNENNKSPSILVESNSCSPEKNDISECTKTKSRFSQDSDISIMESSICHKIEDRRKFGHKRIQLTPKSLLKDFELLSLNNKEKQSSEGIKFMEPKKTPQKSLKFSNDDFTPPIVRVTRSMRKNL